MNSKDNSELKTWMLKHGLPWIYGKRDLLLAQIEIAKVLQGRLAEIEEQVYQWENEHWDLFVQMPDYAERMKCREQKEKGALEAPNLCHCLWLVQTGFFDMWGLSAAPLLLKEPISRASWKTPKRLAKSIQRRNEARRKKRALEKIGQVVEKV